MRATQVEFRLRSFIISAIILLGIWSPGFRTRSLWSALAGWFAHHQIGGMQASSLLIIYAAGLIALAGALLRTWAAAYMGSGIVHDTVLHTHRVVASGPYRYLRNPLYVGSELNFIAIAVLMPWWSGLAVIVLEAVFQYRLILAEEHHLADTPDYADYKARVPQLIPSLRPGVPSSAARPHWGQAFLGEVYFWGAAVSFFVFAGQFNALRILQAVGVCFGFSLIVRAFTGKFVA